MVTGLIALIAGAPDQVVSMQLKDGTFIVVQREGEACCDYQEEEGFAQEEVVEDQCYAYGENYEDQSNQLRARPMLVTPGLVRPVVAPKVVPVIPAPGMVPGMKPLPPHHRGPIPGRVVRPVGPVFRARPAMRPAVVVPKRPGMVPAVRPVPKPMVKPGLVRPILPGTAVRPIMPGQVVKPGMIKPPPIPPIKAPEKKVLVNEMIQAPGVPLRARPTNTDEECDFQEEEFVEDDYYLYDDGQEVFEAHFRAKPLGRVVGVPGKIIGPKVPGVPMGPKVPLVPMGPKRGLVPHHPNTFQPKVFRARPLLRPAPMMAPLAPSVVRPKHHRHAPHVAPPVIPQKYAYGFGPVLRSRPRSSSYDLEEEYIDENELNLTEGYEGSVCSGCGKEF